MNEAHVVPFEDLVAHDSDESCACGPVPKFTEGGVVYVHSALDGRA